MPEEISECEVLNRGISAVCEALNGAGSVDARVYAFNIADVDPDVLAFGPYGGVSDFGLLSGKELYKFISKEYKNTGSHELQPTENGPKVWKHKVDLVHFVWSQQDIETLEKLAKSGKLGFILETGKDQLKVYGLSRSRFQKYGLSAETQTGQEGVLLSDDTTDKTALTGMIKNKPMLFETDPDIDVMIEFLDGLSASNSES
jgi:hypothetical protein